MLLDSYEKIDNYLSKGKNTNDRPAPGNKNNTRIVRVNENTVGIKFYDNIIVSYFKNGPIKLYASKWMTHTTRERMNCFQKKFKVISDSLKWFIDYNGKRYPFEDGITLFSNGLVTYINGSPIEPVNPNSEKYKRMLNYNRSNITKVRNDIDRYCKRFISLFLAGEIPAPSPKDCRYCRKLGETYLFKDHFLEHIEKYEYVPTLLSKAIEGATGGGIITSTDYCVISYHWKKEAYHWKKEVYDAIKNGYEEAMKNKDIQANTQKRLVNILKKYLHEELNVIAMS